MTTRSLFLWTRKRVLVLVVVVLVRWGSCYQIFKSLKLFRFSTDRNLRPLIGGSIPDFRTVSDF